MLYNKDDFQQLRHVGALTSDCLHMLGEEIKIGMTTKDVDDLVKKFGSIHKLICAPMGYKGYPANCCTSVNHVALHGIPSKNKVLKDGDILSIDVTFINDNGYYGDSCRTFMLGTPSRKATIVNDVAYKALWAGIEQVKLGNYIRHIGEGIEALIRKTPSCAILEGWVGHGIGKSFHEKPDIPHTTKNNHAKDPFLPGMVFTIEPIITLGSSKTTTLNDGWTTITKDRSLSAQYEHTIGVTEEGYEIFTI